MVARGGNAVVRIDARPGDFVRKGTALASVVWATVPNERFNDSLRRAFIIGPDRSGTQDVGFFINQLVELGVRALSPGINDPTTARACIDRLEEALCQLTDRVLPSPYRHDDGGALRVVARPVTLAPMFDLAFTELSRYGYSSVSVSCRLLQAIGNVARCLTRNEDRLALARQAAFVGDRSAHLPANDTDRERLAGCYREALEVLHAT